MKRVVSAARGTLAVLCWLLTWSSLRLSFLPYSSLNSLHHLTGELSKSTYVSAYVLPAYPRSLLVNPSRTTRGLTPSLDRTLSTSTTSKSIYHNLMLHKALGNHYNDGDIPRNLRLSDDNDATENILFAILDYNWKNGICKTRILQETDLTIKRLAYISPILTFAQVDGSLHLFDMEDMTSYRLHERLPRKQEIASIAMTFSTRPDNTSSLIQHSTGQWQEIYNDAELVPSFTLDELKSILDEDTLAEFHRNNEQVEMLLASEQPPQPGSGDDEDDEEDVNTMTMMNEEDVHFATSFDEEKSFHNLALEVDNSLSYYHIAMGTSEGEVILYKYVPAPSLVVGHEALDDEIKALEVLQYAYQRHTKSITGLYFYAIPNTTEDNKTMPTQEMMISCSQDRVLLAVDIHSGDLLWRRELSSIPNCMVGNEQYVAIGQSNGSIVIYDVLKGEAMFAVSRNGRASTTNSIDGKSIGKEMSSVRSLHFVSDTVLLAGYQDGHVLRFDFHPEALHVEITTSTNDEDSSTMSDSISTETHPPRPVRFIDVYFQEMSSNVAQSILTATSNAPGTTATIAKSIEAVVESSEASSSTSSRFATPQASSSALKDSNDIEVKVYRRWLLNQTYSDSYDKPIHPNPTAAISIDYVSFPTQGINDEGEGFVNKVVVAHEDGCIVVYDELSAIPLYELQGRSTSITTVVADEERIIADGAANILSEQNFLDVESDEEMKDELAGEESPVGNGSGGGSGTQGGSSNSRGGDGGSKDSTDFISKLVSRPPSKQ